MDSRGTLTISLDFELFWGMHDRRALRSYARNILGVRQAIPRLLDAFERYGIRCTWATVGFLFFQDKEELLQHLPEQRPNYANPALSPYPRIAMIGKNEREDPYHYGLSLIRKIRACPGQEIGTHTFSHYYCLQPGQTPDDFRHDLAAAERAADRLGITLRSLVFPRNQFNDSYLQICRDFGIAVVRGNPRMWFYQSDNSRSDKWIKRGFRRLDQYVPISGHNCAVPERHPTGIINLPASRFLPPMASRVRPLSALCTRRIVRGMTRAARAGMNYHLWWHPHNFGVDLEDNLAALRLTLEHFRRLSETQGMRSCSMGEFAERPEPVGDEALAIAGPCPPSMIGAASSS